MSIDQKMIVTQLRNLQEYKIYVEENQAILAKRFNEMLLLEKRNKNSNFTVKGYSITAEQEVEFSVDWLYSNSKHINWRERLVCPNTGLNNRQRASYHLLKSVLNARNLDNVYITENVTPFYTFLETKIDKLIGSEFIDASLQSGYINEAGIRHEDFTSMSFVDNSLDIILSFDCLEHILDYKTAIKECYRTLKTGGSALLSFPFDKNKHETLIRASISKNGDIQHHATPEYHGDPLTQQGCLSYYTFGWDILEHFSVIGFRDVYAVIYWSDIFGYLGQDQIAFIATK